jgi:hypothetical protein
MKISISISIVVLANMVALSAASPFCCPGGETLCRDDSACDSADRTQTTDRSFCEDETPEAICCTSIDFCGAAAPAPAPAPVDNTPYVFPFTALSFTSGGATQGVFDNLQELSQTQNNGGLPDLAATQESFFGFSGSGATATTAASNNAINTVSTSSQNILANVQNAFP